MKKGKFELNKRVIVCLLFFMVVSIITIKSASMYLSKSLGDLALKQFIWYIIGGFLSFLIVRIGNKYIYKYAWYIYFINIALLFLLLIFGTPINGSRCWFIIPGVGSFQPSEFMKLALIIILSVLISKIQEEKNKLRGKDEFLLLIKVGLLFLLPTILTFLEPDTGVIFIYFIITIFILFASTLRKRWFIISSIIIGGLIFGFFYLYLTQKTTFVNIFGTDLFYRIDRLLDWKKGTGMQLENSLTAIGSSGLLGHGFNQTPIYFPEAGTDFIFAVFASNFGLVGSIILVLILLYFDFHLLNMAKYTKDKTNKMILIGITGMLLYQQFQNIGMTLGILPITGITLPFISYGGSSLLSYMIAIGLILNIYHEEKKTIN